MFNTLSHEGNENKNIIEFLSLSSNYLFPLRKQRTTTNFGEDMDRNNSLYTVSGSIN
jgi:hypothetical protein